MRRRGLPPLWSTLYAATEIGLREQGLHSEFSLRRALYVSAWLGLGLGLGLGLAKPNPKPNPDPNPNQYVSAFAASELGLGLG